MKINEVIKVLDAKMIVGNPEDELEISSACGADLMSDVMAYVKDNVLLLTGLVNPQVVRTAEMMDIKAIAFVRGKRPEESVLNLAKEKGIIVITTKHPMYIACGKLYCAGVTGRGVRD